MGSLSSSVMLSPAGTISPTASPTALTKIQTQISTLKTIFLFTIVGLWVTMANSTSLLERGALNGRVQLNLVIPGFLVRRVSTFSLSGCH